MSEDAIQLLHRLTTSDSGRQRRFTELLKPADLEFSVGWFMCVPKWFNDSLDIRLTERVSQQKNSLVWTQGAEFCFCEGDTLYNTSEAYESWSTAIKKISLCVQVKQAMPAGTSSDGNSRLPGAMTIEVFKPDESQSALVSVGQASLSQDEFVRFLIVGPVGDLAERINVQSGELSKSKVQGI